MSAVAKPLGLENNVDSLKTVHDFLKYVRTTTPIKGEGALKGRTFLTNFHICNEIKDLIERFKHIYPTCPKTLEAQDAALQFLHAIKAIDSEIDPLLEKSVNEEIEKLFAHATMLELWCFLPDDVNLFSDIQKRSVPLLETKCKAALERIQRDDQILRFTFEALLNQPPRFVGFAHFVATCEPPYEVQHVTINFFKTIQWPSAALQEQEMPKLIQEITW